MFDVTVERSMPVINLLDHFQAKVTVVAPLGTLKAILAFAAALLVIYLMQVATRAAGVGNAIQIIRLAQRVAMALLSISLTLVAGVSMVGVQQFDDLLLVMTLGPLIAMVACSIFVGWYHKRHPDDVEETPAREAGR